MYILYYYECDEDGLQNNVQQREEFDSLCEAYERLSDLYNDEETVVYLGNESME